MSSSAASKRGQTECDDVETEIQVAAECSLLHFRGKIAVRGGDDAEVRPANQGRSDGAKFFLLQYAQQLRLKVERKLADFIEERGTCRSPFRSGRAWVPQLP